jgi:hypothetical protein
MSMPEPAAYTNRTEAVGLFHSAKEMECAIDELLGNGFARMDLNVMATEAAIEKKLGHAYRSVREIEDNPDIPTTAFVSTESRGDLEGAVIGSLIYIPATIGTLAVVASGGTLAAALTAMLIAAGTGGVFGSVLAHLIGKRHADVINDHLQHGGLLLWVRTRDSAHEERAVSIMKTHGAEDVHLHTLPALTNW